MPDQHHRRRREPNTTTGPRFRYTGQQLIGELGLYHYKARFYSPTLGRFLQTDPIGYKDDVNLYAYPSPFETLRTRAGRRKALKHRRDPIFDESPLAVPAVSLQHTELAPGWAIARVGGERRYAGHASTRECNAGALLWVVAIMLAVLLVWCALAFHLPEKPSMACALSVGMGALLLPFAAVAMFSLRSDYPSERKNLKFFVGCCTALLAISVVSTFVTRGNAERWLRERVIVAGDDVALMRNEMKVEDTRT